MYTWKSKQKKTNLLILLLPNPLIPQSITHTDYSQHSAILDISQSVDDFRCIENPVSRPHSANEIASLIPRLSSSSSNVDTGRPKQTTREPDTRAARLLYARYRPV